jgi:hypothetical protein
VRYSPTGTKLVLPLTHLVLYGQQAEHEDGGPLLPPDFFPELEHRPASTKEARFHYRQFIMEKDSCRRKRKFCYGALYKELYPGYYLIDLSESPVQSVDVRLSDANGKESIVRIRSAILETELLQSVTRFAKTLPKKGNCRQDTGDEGHMFALGYKSMDPQNPQIYVPTYEPVLRAAMASATTELSRYMTSHFPQDLRSIREAEDAKFILVPPDKRPTPLIEMGGKNGPGNCLMISRDLVNSSHIDYRDKSRSLSLWVEEMPGQATGWYFIMPEATINGRLGVVVRLFHGCSISWDGKLIKHCSTVSKLGPNNHVYGCYVGSCRD